MLRINLLPPYIYDKQKKLPFIIGSLALIPITGIAMMMWNSAAQAELTKANDRRTAAQTQQQQYNQYVAAITAEKNTVAATKARETFIANSIKYNASWPKVYTAMRDVTSPKVLLHSMYVSEDRKSINVSGFCAYEEDLVRWWMYLRSQSALFTNVYVRLPDHPWPPKGEGAAAGGGGGQGASMASNMGGGSPGGSSNATGAAVNEFPGMRQGTGSGAMPGGMPGGSGGMPGGGGNSGGGGGSGSIGPTEIEGRKGINFTALAMLKEPLAGGIATPGWGSGAAGGGAAGGAPQGSSAAAMGQ